MPLFHDTLWSVTAIDIEYTLAKVMTRVRRPGEGAQASQRAKVPAESEIVPVFQKVQA